MTHCPECDVPLVPAVWGWECGMHPLAELEKVEGYVIKDGAEAFMDWDCPADGPILARAGNVEKRVFFITPDECDSFLEWPEKRAEMWCPECGDY